MKSRLIVLLIFVVCCLAGSATAKSIDKHFHESFDVKKGASLDLKFDDGDVTITPWNKDVLEIDIVYMCDYTKIGLGKDPGFDVDFKQRGKTVDVQIDEWGASVVGVFTRDVDRFDIEIKAPDWLILELAGDDGDVNISDWRADVKLSVDDGNVYLNNIVSDEIVLRLEDGDLEAAKITAGFDARSDDGSLTLEDCKLNECMLKTEDGDIRVKKCAGNFELKTDDGNIRLRDMKIGKVVAELDDGDFGLTVEKSSELDIEVVTEDGDVDIVLDSDASAEYDLRADSGDIDVEGNERSDRDDRRRRTGDDDEDEHQSGRFGNGKGNIEVSVDDGEISLIVRR